MMNIEEILVSRLGKEVKDCSNEELYGGLLEIVQEMAEKKAGSEGKKKIYYVSAEFLIGKLLSNNMINLGIYKEVKDLLAKNGKHISEIEELEAEPSLGNGGLGRLAACFLDSIATLGYSGEGIGLKSWLKKTDVSYPVKFGKLTLQSRMYEIAVTGYENRTNKLRLFDVDSVDEGIVKDGIDFDKDDIAKNLTLFLYPDDSDEAGRKLRILW